MFEGKLVVRSSEVYISNYTSAFSSERIPQVDAVDIEFAVNVFVVLEKLKSLSSRYCSGPLLRKVLTPLWDSFDNQLLLYVSYLNEIEFHLFMYPPQISSRLVSS